MPFTKQIRVVLTMTGIFCLVSSSPYSPDGSEIQTDDFVQHQTSHPPRSHHHPHGHLHHGHHDGSRRDRDHHESSNHHYHHQHEHFHQEDQYYEQRQNKQEEQQTIQQQPEFPSQDSQQLNSELHHQEDSPYYGGYASSNRYTNNHVNCQLPEAWKGKWFQSGIQNPVLIDSKSIEGKGTCYESSGDDKFLFVEKGNCHRCVVINQRHPNVLMYKESLYCEEKNSLENLCTDIPGDANLYSLFRIDAVPIVCPFKPPYTFSYNKGTGDCKNPISHVDTCTEPSRLVFRYQACPDVLKSESTVEELQCIGSWRDGTYHYLVGKLNYQLAISNEDRYRCFVYEKGQTIVKLAVSGDGSCQGVQSPTEGAKTMKLTKANTDGGIKCKFPNWVSQHHWHSLDGKLSIKTSNKNSTMHIVDTSAQDPSASSSSSGGHQHHHHTNTGGISSRGGGIYTGSFGNSVTSSGFGIQNTFSLFSGGTRITCQASKELTEEHFAVVAQHTEGCTTTTVCMHFYKRDGHVIELQISKKGSGYYEDYDCGKPEALGPMPYVTLISADVNSKRCPYLGKYMTTEVTQDGRLVAGGDLCITSPPANNNGGGGNFVPNIQQTQHGSFHSVVVGCGQRATMDFHSKCVTQEPITSYECSGSWEENGVGFLIASPLSRSSNSARRYCFTYLETQEGLQFFSSSESCRRDVSPNVEGIWAFNLTVDGQCAEAITGAASRSLHCDVYYSYFLATLLVLVTFSSNAFSFSSSILEELFYSLFAKISHYHHHLLYDNRKRISSPLLTSHSSRRMAFA